MATKTGDLVSKLIDKDSDEEIEFIIVKTDGSLVCVDVENTSDKMIEFLKMFKGGV